MSNYIHITKSDGDDASQRRKYLQVRQKVFEVIAA